MIETGVVENVLGDRAEVRPKKSDACFGCLNYECKRNAGVIIARNALRLPLKKGQLVETEVPTASALLQGALAMAPVFLGFIAGYLLAGAFTPRESVRAFCGMAGLFIAAGSVYLFRKKRPPREICRILRIVG